MNNRPNILNVTIPQVETVSFPSVKSRAPSLEILPHSSLSNHYQNLQKHPQPNTSRAHSQQLRPNQVVQLNSTYRVESPKHTLSQSNPFGLLTSINAIMEGPKTSTRQSNNSEFLDQPNQSWLNRFLRLVTIFLAKNWYIIRWFVIAALLCLIILVLLPAVLA